MYNDLTRILSGFKSRWLIGGFKLCRYISPLAIPLLIVHTWLLGSPWDSGVLWSSTNLYRFFGIYSITRKGLPVLSTYFSWEITFSNVTSHSKMFIPLKATMLSCRRSLKVNLILLILINIIINNICLISFSYNFD